MTRNRVSTARVESTEPVDHWTRPTATFLRPLIVKLLSDGSAPSAIRDAAEQLLDVISSNNLPEIVERLARLRVRAERADYQLPITEADLTPRK